MAMAPAQKDENVVDAEFQEVDDDEKKGAASVSRSNAFFASGFGRSSSAGQSSKRDYYEVLGSRAVAGRTRSKPPIASSRRNSIPTAIPATTAAEHKFKEVNEAYDVLKDDQKRAAYDRFGHAAFEGAGRAGRRAGFDFAS